MAKLKRRQFLGAAGTAGAATFLAPHFNIGASGASPNEKPNIAMVGNGGIAGMAYGGLKGGGGHNIVAICDVDKGRHNNHKNAFVDFRKMYDKMGKEIDGVCINCPDHTHFAATITAMELGMHVCTQKPLTHNLWQARTLLKAAKKYPKVITNMANQGHARGGIRLMKEIYEAGLLGQVTEVHAGFKGPNWKSRYFHKPSKLPLPKQEVPGNLDWKQWIGPGKMVDYNKAFHPLRWRSFWDYGTGMLGDWFCHIGDGPVWGLELFDPVSVERLDCKENIKGIIPDYATVKWEFPKRGDKAPCTLTWSDGWMNGGRKAKSGQGSLWIGDKKTGRLNERSDDPRIDGMSKRELYQMKKNGKIPKKYPRLPGQCNDRPHGEWLLAIKGKLPEGMDKPGSSFEYSAKMTEVCLLGVLAERCGGKIEWDAKNCKVTNRPELNELVKEPVLNGWEDYGKDLWKS